MSKITMKIFEAISSSLGTIKNERRFNTIVKIFRKTNMKYE
jgi:hypothetical protein